MLTRHTGPESPRAAVMFYRLLQGLLSQTPSDTVDPAEESENVSRETLKISFKVNSQALTGKEETNVCREVGRFFNGRLL